jgi:hypothetical protein
VTDLLVHIYQKEKIALEECCNVRLGGGVGGICIVCVDHECFKVRWGAGVGGMCI